MLLYGCTTGVCFSLHATKQKMYRIIKFIAFIFPLVYSCNIGYKFDEEFKNHTNDSDVISNIYPSMTINAYVKNNKAIGFENICNNEFGLYTKKTFVNNSGEIERIIIRKLYERYESFDSIYVLEPKLDKITVYSEENQKGEEIIIPNMIEHELFDVTEEYNQILEKKL